MDKTLKHDPVNHPVHYMGGKFESIDVIEAYGLGFHLGNAFKYIVRQNQKGGLEDINKACWYLSRFADRQAEQAHQLARWIGLELGTKPPWATPSEIAEDFELPFLLAAAVETLLILPSARNLVDGVQSVLVLLHAHLKRESLVTI